MALFGRKSSDDQTEQTAAPVVDASKARPWFDRARTVHDASNYEYAVTCWLQGLRYDPGNVDAVEACFKSAAAFLAGRKKTGPSKDQQSNFSGRSPLDRYLAALLESCTNPLDAKAAVKAMESASKLDLAEATHWLGERALTLAVRDRKPRKDLLVRIKDAAKAVGAYDIAAKAGEAAISLDPTDAGLINEIKQLSAEAAMASGGFEETGKAGGFRKRIRDSEKQRILEEESRIVRSEDAATRVIEAAKKDYESRPEDPNSLIRYVRALRARGKPEDEDLAHELLMKGYEQHGQFRFREEAGALRVRQRRRELRALEKKAEAGDEQAVAALKQKRRELLELELQEHLLRVKEYPTDLSIKYETARRLAALGRHEEAIPLLQQAQDDAKLRLRAMTLLGECFSKAGFEQEAVDTFRMALEQADEADDEVVLALRYGLMASLMSKATALRDAAAAEEALKLASAIMLKQFNYRDIRDRREQLQRLVQELRDAEADG
ncbi:MAG: hypothetical protein D6824_01280 [Planctomycetota bacterium]|nr:MAG: hypothetical protein D6824_01280 [Planctomycetota bacterium]